MTSERPDTPAATSRPGHDIDHHIRDVVADESLLARARTLEPIIREHAGTTERQRRLASPVLHAMREAGLFRMFTPRALGGCCEFIPEARG